MKYESPEITVSLVCPGILSSLSKAKSRNTFSIIPFPANLNTFVIFFNKLLLEKFSVLIFLNQLYFHLNFHSYITFHFKFVNKHKFNKKYELNNSMLELIPTYSQII